VTALLDVLVLLHLEMKLSPASSCSSASVVLEEEEKERKQTLLTHRLLVNAWYLRLNSNIYIP
jgi:hypothetical protein